MNRISSGNPKTPTRAAGFTLIELLIVVAIIAILAAIAVPNFLEAQVRSKVSRVKSDLRTMRTAAEAYAVDNNHYPRTSWGGAPYNDVYQGQPIFGTFVPNQITTPITYMTSLPLDPFAINATQQADILLYTYQDLYTLQYLSSIGTLTPVPGMPGYVYIPGNAAFFGNMEYYMGKYFLWSTGPGGADQELPAGGSEYFFQTYDPTNGTVSNGHIFVTQKRTEPYYLPVNAFP